MILYSEPCITAAQTPEMGMPFRFWLEESVGGVGSYKFAFAANSGTNRFEVAGLIGNQLSVLDNRDQTCLVPLLGLCSNKPLLKDDGAIGWRRPEQPQQKKSRRQIHMCMLSAICKPGSVYQVPVGARWDGLRLQRKGPTDGMMVTSLGSHVVVVVQVPDG